MNSVSQTPLEFLLTAARWAMEVESDQALEAAAADVKDWDAVIELASRNALIPLMARSLRDSKIVPLTVRRELYRRYFESNSQNALLSTELRDLIHEFRREGIDVLAYKGSALVAMAYGNLPLRHPPGDIDLVLHKADIDRAKKLMEDRSYSLWSPETEKHFLKYRYHLHYERREPEIHVELHWALTPTYWPFALDEHRLWKESHSVTVAGANLPTLDPECTILALCAHGAKEGWPRLSHVLDLGRLIQSHPSLDWDWILAEARRMRRERVVLLGLWLVIELLNARIPAQALAQIRAGIGNDPEIARLGLQIQNNFTVGRSGGSDFHKYAMRVWHHTSDKLRYLSYLCLVFPDKLRPIVRPTVRDKEFANLGDAPSILYFLVRPIRVMFQYRDVRLMVRALMKNL